MLRFLARSLGADRLQLGLFAVVGALLLTAGGVLGGGGSVTEAYSETGIGLSAVDLRYVTGVVDELGVDRAIAVDLLGTAQGVCDRLWQMTGGTVLSAVELHHFAYGLYETQDTFTYAETLLNLGLVVENYCPALLS